MAKKKKTKKNKLDAANLTAKQTKQDKKAKKLSLRGGSKKDKSAGKTSAAAQVSSAPVAKPKTVKLIPVPEWINLKDGLMREIEAHAYSVLDAEVGGMLFGKIEDGKVNIQGFVPARNASVDQISLTFTHEVWDDILAEGNQKFPDTQIVGWYHTHPSFGLFLSEYDAFIQRNFFSSNRQLALVIDPISGHHGWFANGTQPDEIVTLGVAETVSGPARPPQKESTSLASSRSTSRLSMKTVLGMLVISIVSGLVGYGIAASKTPPDLSNQYMALQNAYQNVVYGGGAYQYGVQAGDTWESVSKTFYGDVAGIEVLKLQNPDLKDKQLKAGEFIVIYAPTNLNFIENYSPRVEQTPTPTPTTPTPTPTPSASSTKPNPFPTTQDPKP